MWFRNRLVNPVVLVLLRSPLHPVLSRSLMILSYQGRKTGRWRSLPCMYARDGPDLYVVPGQPTARSGGATCASPPESGCTSRAGIWRASPPPVATPRPWPSACPCIWARYPKAAKPLGVPLDASGTPTAHHGRPPAGRGQHPP
jgi:hypothetical protein